MSNTFAKYLFEIERLWSEGFEVCGATETVVTMFRAPNEYVRVYTSTEATTTSIK